MTPMLGLPFVELKKVYKTLKFFRSENCIVLQATIRSSKGKAYPYSNPNIGGTAIRS